MSRIGKKIITVPNGVTVTLKDSQVMVKGPKGELQLELHPSLVIKLEGDQLVLDIKNEADRIDKKVNALWGLFRNLVNNLIIGVSTGYEKKLELNGVGFKVAVAGSKLLLNVGFSHQVEFPIPEGIKIETKANLITVSGIDKALVGQVSANIRGIKKPEPYKGKGIKYSDEVIRRKAGKSATKAA